MRHWEGPSWLPLPLPRLLETWKEWKEFRKDSSTGMATRPPLTPSRATRQTARGEEAAGPRHLPRPPSLPLQAEPAEPAWRRARTEPPPSPRPRPGADAPKWAAEPSGRHTSKPRRATGRQGRSFGQCRRRRATPVRCSWGSGWRCEGETRRAAPSLGGPGPPQPARAAPRRPTGWRCRAPARLGHGQLVCPTRLGCRWARWPRRPRWRSGRRLTAPRWARQAPPRLLRGQTCKSARDAWRGFAE